MKRTYERPQQKMLCGSLLTVIATSWNDGDDKHQVIEGHPDEQDDRGAKGRGWDVFGE